MKIILVADMKMEDAQTVTGHSTVPNVAERCQKILHLRYAVNVITEIVEDTLMIRTETLIIR